MLLRRGVPIAANATRARRSPTLGHKEKSTPKAQEGTPAVRRAGAVDPPATCPPPFTGLACLQSRCTSGDEHARCSKHCNLWARDADRPPKDPATSSRQSDGLWQVRRRALLHAARPAHSSVARTPAKHLWQASGGNSSKNIASPACALQNAVQQLRWRMATRAPSHETWAWTCAV